MQALQQVVGDGVALLSLPSLQTLLRLSLVPTLHRSNHQELLAPYQACSHPQLSCHNTSEVPDTCCFNYPGGEFLQTQFWDARPAVGPVDSWTIHGLWPDHCHGGFDQYCDPAREYSNISAILSSHESTSDLLSFMQTYWLPNQGVDESLWSHEWNKHGVCISTLEPKCFPPSLIGTPTHPDVLAYFNTTVSLFRNLDTYTFLADAGIVPSMQTTYTLSHLQNTLRAIHGTPVTLRCHGHELNEVWYHFAVRGPLQNGNFVPSNPTNQHSSCPPIGIRYLPKEPAHSPTHPTHTTNPAKPTSTTPPEPFKGKGHLQIRLRSPSSSSLNSLSFPSPHPQTSQGCLISSGHWYHGSCANYQVQDDADTDPGDPTHYFTLTSRRGPCSINEVGAFECDRSLPFQTIFTAANASGDADGEIGREGEGESVMVLSYRNRTTFYASNEPERFEKVEIYADDGGEDEERPVELEIFWAGVG